jgi:hypothetical protein
MNVALTQASLASLRHDSLCRLAGHRGRVQITVPNFVPTLSIEALPNIDSFVVPLSRNPLQINNKWQCLVTVAPAAKLLIHHHLLVRDQEAEGSNPPAPTNSSQIPSIL